MQREPEVLEPRAEQPPSQARPAHSLQQAVPEEVLALAALDLDDGAHLLVLGRRTLFLLRVDGDTAEVVHQADLLAHVRDKAQLARRARGCLQFLEPQDGSPEPWLHVFSTALGVEPAGAAAFRIQGHRLVALEPRWMETAGGLGPCDAFQEGEQSGWPGRAWVVSSDVYEPVFFHLERSGALAARAASGGERVFEGPWGEPLTAQGDSQRARLYLSSASLPGQPDRVQELEWQGGTLAPSRHSRSFAGRVAAMLLLPHDGRAVVAEVTEPHGTLLHILRDEDLWVEDLP